MTDVRAKAAPVVTVLRLTADVRAMAVPVVSVIKVAAEVRAKAVPIVTVHRVIPELRLKHMAVVTVARSTKCTGRWCQVWEITRLDGEVFRFTSLDRDLVYGGRTYKSCGSLTPSAVENAAEIGGASNQELAGVFSEADGITQADLAAGLFDGAYVESWRVPWGNEGGAPFLLQRGTLAKAVHGPNGFTAELLGAGGRLLQTPLTRTLKPDCDYEFGDERTCRKDLTGLIVAGTVDEGVGQRGFTDAARGETAGYFKRGRVTFTSGANAGVTAEIKEHEAGGVFELWPALANPIAAGDGYTMKPGCTNLKTSEGGCNGCIAWDNLVNYGGFDTVPGGDAVRSNAGVRTS